MQYTFIHHHFSDNWTKEAQIVLDQAVALAARPASADFVYECCRFFYDIFQIKVILIGKIVSQQPERVRALCMLHNGRQVKDVVYNIEGTPCENVTNFGVCYYPFGIQKLFPKDRDLVKMGVDSYMGTPINDAEHNRIGMVALLHHETIQQAALIEACLTILAPRLEEELQRQ